MALNVARRAYSAEQLLALRESASDEPALKIETRAEEGAIKDHVLRNAHSFAARSTRSFNASDTLRPPSHEARGPVLSEIDPNNQTLRPGSTRHRPSPSPTLDLEKRKAEQILKDHGSPPGLRVTAGGRIVPSDQSPLCSPRFGYSAIQKNGGLIRFAPNYPPPPGSSLAIQETAKTLSNGFVAQDPSGRLLQVVDGQFLPVNEINGIPQLYIAAPNLNNFPPGKMHASSARQQTSQGRESSSAPASRMRQPTLTNAIQIQALEKQYVKLEQESRDLDKLEVLQRSTMSSKAYQQLIQSRRELVTRLNDIRVSLKALRDQQQASPELTAGHSDEHNEANSQHMPLYAALPMLPHAPLHQGPISGWSYDGVAPDTQGMMQFPGGPLPMQPDLGFLVPQPGTYPGHMAPYPAFAAPAGPFPPLFNMMGIPPVEMFHGFQNAVSAAPQMFPIQAPQMQTSAGAVPKVDVAQIARATNGTTSTERTSPRRSQAVEVKKPDATSDGVAANKSSLNPMSPSYQPASIGSKPSTPQSKPSRQMIGSPSPALAEAVRAHNAWVGETRAASNPKQAFEYDSSNASYATADFFPSDPRDHSMNKQAYPVEFNRSLTSIKRSDGVTSAVSTESLASPEKERHNPNWNPTIPDTAFDSMVTPSTEQEITAAPSGSPAAGDVGAKEDPVSNRSVNNMSPKNRRPDLLLLNQYKSVSEIAVTGSGPTSPVTAKPVEDCKTSSASLRPPVSSSGSAYNEGFKAGEARLPIGPDTSGVWLDGYCAGLRASMPGAGEDSQRTVPTASYTSTSQGVEPVQNPRLLQDPTRPPLELNVSSFDTLKEAVFSSQNENAVLSPSSAGPTVSELGPASLGAWSKKHGNASSTESVLTQMRNGEATTSDRNASMMQRQLVDAEGLSKDAKSAASVAEPRRNFSAQSQPNAMGQTPYQKVIQSGNRVLSSQLEWKSGSSLAQIAGLARGYVAHFDGTLNDIAALGDMAPLTRISGNAGADVTDSKLSKTKTASNSPGYSRFVEGSMRSDDGAGDASPRSSPSKKSPTKAKFAHIAGKAGIKVRMEDQAEQERLSPKDKPRWRDVWRRGN